MRKSIVYYTDHHLPPALAALCREQLIRAAGGAEMVTVGLNDYVGFGTREIILSGERGVKMMLNQIREGLRFATGDYVFLCEHDVLYHPTHFEFVPPRMDTFYYNTNVWHVRYPDGHAVYYYAQQVSGLCAGRALLLDFYEKRIRQVAQSGHNRHYEPGLRQTVGGQRVENWRSLFPNLDVRHGQNLTASKWSLADFRNPRYAEGWQTAAAVEGWGALADLFAEKV